MESSAFRSFRMVLGMGNTSEETAASQPLPSADESEQLKPRTDSASSSCSSSAHSHDSSGSCGNGGGGRGTHKHHRRHRRKDDSELDQAVAGGGTFAVVGDDSGEDAREDVICAIFDLPRSTTFYKDFSCAIAAAFPMHGRMYPTSTHVCFYSNVFGRERKILIPYESITELSKTTTLLFQSAIRIRTSTSDDFTFMSFWGTNRDDCFDLISHIRDQDSSSSLPPNVAAGAVAAESKELEEEEDAQRHEQLLRRTVSDGGMVAVARDTTMELLLQEKLGVSVDAFLAAFVSDNASFGLVQYNARIGTTEMQCNPWSPLSDDASLGRTRSLQFRVPIDAPIGPSSSTVDVLQCHKTSEKGIHTIETSTRLVDIPYGDYFSVEDRWTIVPHPRHASACSLTIELKVVFSKSTIWRSKIESRALADNKTKWLQWVEMAKEHLAGNEGDPTTNGTVAHPLEDNNGSVVAEAAQATVIVENPPNGTPLLSAVDVAEPRRRSPSRRTAATAGVVVEPRDADALRNRSPTGVVSAKRRRRASPQALPWIVLVVILVWIIVRLHNTLGRMEQTLLTTEQRVVEIQEQIAQIRTELGVCR